MDSPAEKHVSWLSDAWAAVASTALLLVICSGVYPLLVWGVAQVAFPWRANGSLIQKDGSTTTSEALAVGSVLLGQNFTSSRYFHPRPSAAGNGYDASNSAGTNLGPTSDKLIHGVHDSKNADGTANPVADFPGVQDLVSQYRRGNDLADSVPVPGDAVTRSGSGLDPHISPGNAQLQAMRVANTRGLDVATVREMIERYTEGPGLGIFGDAGVNVLRLNLALDAASPAIRSRAGH